MKPLILLLLMAFQVSLIRSSMSSSSSSSLSLTALPFNTSSSTGPERVDPVMRPKTNTIFLYFVAPAFGGLIIILGSVSIGRWIGARCVVVSDLQNPSVSPLSLPEQP